MKKTILKLIVFAACFFTVDTVLGTYFTSIQNKVKGGSIGKNNYIANQANEDIIIFGSSKGAKHYNPVVISNALGMSCYNCAEDANGIVLMYGRYKLLTERYTPKIIIYDLRPNYDFYLNDNKTFLTLLKPFYGRLGIDSIFLKVDKNERIKMSSHLYRFNYIFIDILKGTNLNSNINGFDINKCAMSSIPAKSHLDKNDTDKIKMFFMEELIRDCLRKHIKLFFVCSPEFFNQDYNYEPVQLLSDKYNIPFFYCSDDSEIVRKKQYFFDSVHMNYYGATLFSSKVANMIKPYLKQ